MHMQRRILRGWDKREALAKVQGRYVITAIGMNANTPKYIWSMEAGARSIAIESRKRPSCYLVSILKMSDKPWPITSLKRGDKIYTIDNNSSKWGVANSRRLRQRLGMEDRLNKLTTGINKNCILARKNETP